MATMESPGFPSPLVLKEIIQFQLKVPVVFKNTLTPWEKVPWTAEKLLENYGNVSLNFRLFLKTSNDISWEGTAIYVKSTIYEFMEWQNPSNSTLPKSNPFFDFKTEDYWAYSSYNYLSDIFSENADITKAVDWTMFGYPDTSAKDSAFWIGSAGSYTPCHFDTYGFNFVAQIQGRKRWLLFPPKDTAFMYPTRIPYEESSIFSSVNTLNPNFKEHPLFQLSHPHIVTLEPGDVLFVPNKWWHFVESLDDVTISINTWMKYDSDNETRLEEGVARALMTSLISCFEPEDESWLNIKEELVSPEETLMYISSELNKIKYSNTNQSSQNNATSSCHDQKSSKKHAKSDVHSNFSEISCPLNYYHKDIEYVLPTVFSIWYGNHCEIPSKDVSQNVNVKTIVNCFVHPEVISVICKLLKNM